MGEYISKVKQAIEDKKNNKISYTDFGDIILGADNNYSKDNIRKAYYILSKMIDKLESDVLTEDDIIAKNEELKNEIIKERKKLQATKLETLRNVNHEARFELFYENVKESFESLPVPQFEYIDSEENDRAYVLGISDIHYGANFTSINNHYSIEECKRRFDVLFNKTVKEIKREGITTLKVLNLSDSIQGILRISDVKLNEVAVVDAVVGVSKLIASFLNELSKYCYIEYIHVGSANHSQTRPLGSKASELANEDLEKVIVNYIHDALQFNERVKVKSTDGSDRVLFKIFDFECIALHGHQIKNIKNAIKDLSILHKKFFDFTFLGHSHMGQSMFNGESDVCCETIVVPSFIGSDPYSDKLALGSKAMAQLYTFDNVEGHIQTTNFLLN